MARISLPGFDLDPDETDRPAVASRLQVAEHDAEIPVHEHRGPAHSCAAWRGDLRSGQCVVDRSAPVWRLDPGRHAAQQSRHRQRAPVLPVRRARRRRPAGAVRDAGDLADAARDDPAPGRRAAGLRMAATPTGWRGCCWTSWYRCRPSICRCRSAITRRCVRWRRRCRRIRQIAAPSASGRCAWPWASAH